jgi:cobalt-zinc-cadmium efflux system protein
MSNRLHVAFVLTSGFMMVEAVTGWLTGSLALMSDAGHMLTDSTSLGVAVLTTAISQKPADLDHSLGHGRAEVLGAGLTAAGLVVLAAWIGVEAIGRLRHPVPVEAGGMMLVAVLGLIVNIAMAFLLARGEGIQNRAALLNVMGDALGSVGVIVAGALIAWKGWLIADPIVSLVIAVLILAGALRVLREVVSVLMQAVPDDLDLSMMQDELVKVEGVQSVHDLHAWTIRPGEEVVSVHVVLRTEAPPIETCRQVETAVRRFLPDAHITVQPERF